MKKFALISLGLPPSQSGQSMVLYHLLKQFDPQKLLFDYPEKFSSVQIPWELFDSAHGKIFFFASGLPDYQTDD